MSIEPKYIRSPQADATMAGDRAAIYHRETRKAITLNPAGTILWQELSQHRTKLELVQSLCNRWPQLEEATAISDVEKFLEQLQSHQLIATDPAA